MPIRKALAGVVATALGITVCSWAPRAEAVGQTPQASPAPRPPVIGQGTAAISGVVLDATTGRPVTAAIVSITPQTGNIVARGVRQITDATGRFVFTDLEAGDGYLLGARRFGYFDGAFGRDTPSGTPRRVAVKDGEWFSTATIRLWKPAAISGSVTDEAGEPIAGAYVRLLASLLVAGVPQAANGPTTRTDDRGVYRLANLVPGRYYVSLPSVQMAVPADTSLLTLSGTTPEAVASAEAAGRSVPLRRDPAIAIDPRNHLLIGSFVTPPPRPATGRRLAYPPTYYPAARSRADAAVIELGYGDDRAGVNVQIAPVPTARVSGRVEGPADAMAMLTLRLMAAGDEGLGTGSETATALVASDGSFVFLNVPEGRYSILASHAVSEYTYSGTSSSLAMGSLPSPPARSTGGESGSAVFSGPPGTGFSTRGQRGAGSHFARVAVSVGGGDLSDVVVRLQRGVSMSGTIVNERTGTAPVSPIRSPLLAEPADGDVTLGRFQASSDPDGSGRFTIEGLRAGHYLLRLIAGGTVRSITWNGTDHTYTPFDTSAGQDLSGIVITTTDQIVAMNGIVSDARGLPVTDGAVIYFPVEREQWQRVGLQPSRMRSVVVSSGGTFTVIRIPAGTYYLIAVPRNLSDRWTDPKFLEAAAPLATRVTAGWGETKTQNLVLQQVR